MRADNDPARAQTILDQALRLDPDFPAARRWNAFLRVLRIQAGISNDSSALRQAEQELQQLLTEYPQYSQVHGGLAMVYLHQGRKDLVRQQLSIAKSMGLSDPQTAFLQVLTDYFDGRGEAAYEGCARLLESVPVFVGATVIMAAIESERGELSDSIAKLEAIDIATPNGAQSKSYLTLAYLYGGDTKRARATIDRVRAGAPQNYLLRLAETVVLAQEGRRKEALAGMDPDLEAFARVDPFATIEAAYMHAQSGDPQKALDWLEEAVRIGDERTDWFRRCPLLAPLRKDPRFRQIVETVEKARRAAR